MSGAANTYAYLGTQGPSSGNGEFNPASFIAENLINRIRTVHPVQVKTVYTQSGGTATPGAIAPAGYVDVLPLVNQLDGYGNATPHGTVYGVPYFRLIGGSNAVIIDPEAGDLGFMACCDRDISSVKANQGQANPGSRRQHSFEDGIYLGGFFGKSIPTQVFGFTDQGIFFVDKNNNRMVTSSAGIAFTTPNLTCTGNITAGQGSSDQIDMQNHLHMDGGGVGNSGRPVPGT